HSRGHDPWCDSL
ncbi:hypothetical protein BN1708_019678, partial [Verticillium longisporum]